MPSHDIVVEATALYSRIERDQHASTDTTRRALDILERIQSADRFGATGSVPEQLRASLSGSRDISPETCLAAAMELVRLARAVRDAEYMHQRYARARTPTAAGPQRDTPAQTYSKEGGAPWGADPRGNGR